MEINSMTNLISDDGAKRGIYSSPSVKIVPVASRALICTSGSDPKGTSNEGYEEETLTW